MFTVGFALTGGLADPTGAALPGAASALAAIREHGGRSVAVTERSVREARLQLGRLDLHVDAVAGSATGAARRSAALRRHHLGVLVASRRCDLSCAQANAIPSVGLPEFPAWLDEQLLPGRLAVLLADLARLESVLVAFSGGADSAFLLAASVRALGRERVGALTAVSPSLPEVELAAARSFTAGLGVTHLLARTDELDRPGYRENGPQRCYFCKTELVEVAGRLAAERGYAALATGTNADDARAGFRPGIRAAAEHGAITPLLAAGLTKSQVRAASRAWGLVTWDKPAAACLSSRVAYGISITPGRLARVARAEQALRAALDDAGLACRDLRVRDLGRTARVEVDADLVDELTRRPHLLGAVEGFTSVTLDPRGFRSGSMNEAL